MFELDFDTCRIKKLIRRSNCDIIQESEGKEKCTACLSPEIMLWFKEIFSQNYVT